MRRTLLLGTIACSMLLAQTAATAPGSLPETVTLEQAIQEALAKNLDLAAERYNISVAEARQITARLRPNPVLTVSGQTLDLLGAGFSASSPVGPNQLNVHTDFVLERGSKRANRMAYAASDKAVAESGVRETMRRVIYDVQSAFVDVQEAESNLKLAQENLTSLQGIVQINEAKVKSGELAAVELDRSRLAAMQFETAVEQARLTLQQSKTRLQLLIGRQNHSANFDVSGPIRRDPGPATEMAIHDLALTQRPDIQVIQQTQARSQADLKLQVAQSKVDFLVGTEYSYQRDFGYGGSTLGFSFSAPLPIFNKNQGEIARAQREIDQAAARLNALRNNVSTDVETAWRQYQTSQRLLSKIETDMLSKARSVRDITEYSYRRGEASLVEFLDAQRAFNDTVQSYNQARANYARSLYLIDSVSGASVTTAASGGTTN